MGPASTVMAWFCFKDIQSQHFEAEDIHSVLLSTRSKRLWDFGLRRRDAAVEDDDDDDLTKIGPPDARPCLERHSNTPLFLRYKTDLLSNAFHFDVNYNHIPSSNIHNNIVPLPCPGNSLQPLTDMMHTNRPQTNPDRRRQTFPEAFLGIIPECNICRVDQLGTDSCTD